MLLELLYNAAAPFCCIYNVVAVIMLMLLLDNAADVVIKSKLVCSYDYFEFMLLLPFGCCCLSNNALPFSMLLRL